jgi:hypothetical protein
MVLPVPQYCGMMSRTVQEHQSALVLDHSQVGMWHLVTCPSYVLVSWGTGFCCTGVSSNIKLAHDP